MCEHTPRIDKDTKNAAALAAREKDLQRLQAILRSAACVEYCDFLVREEMRRYPAASELKNNDYFKELQRFVDSSHANERIRAHFQGEDSLVLLRNFVLDRATNPRFLSPFLVRLCSKDRAFVLDMWLRSCAEFVHLLFLAKTFDPDHAVDYYSILDSTPIVQLAFRACRYHLRRRFPNRNWTEDQLQQSLNETRKLAVSRFPSAFSKYEDKEGFRFKTWYFKSVARSGVRQALASPRPRLPAVHVEAAPVLLALTRPANLISNFKKLSTPEEFTSYIARSSLLSDREKLALRLFFEDGRDDTTAAGILGLASEEAVRTFRKEVYRKLAKGLLLDFAMQDDLTRVVVKSVVYLYPAYISDQAFDSDWAALLNAVSELLGLDNEAVLRKLQQFLERLQQHFGLSLSPEVGQRWATRQAFLEALQLVASSFKLISLSPNQVESEATALNKEVDEIA